MPANLTPQYHSAEEEFKRAQTPADQLAALQLMLRAIPKHKGTDKLQGELKKKISRLRQSLKGSKAAGSKKGYSIHVPKEGIGQFALVGAPNSGKSSILDSLTNASPEIAPYQFTTRQPQPAMAKFENVQIQLVDLPPISDQYLENWVPALIRYADVVLLTTTLDNPDFLGNLDDVLRIMEEHNITLAGDDVENDVSGRLAVKRSLIVATHSDSSSAAEHLEICEEFFGDRFRIVPFSTQDPSTGNSLVKICFELMDVIRIYTRAPGKTPSYEQPFVLSRGSTVTDLATAVHKELGENISSARGWGSTKFPGQNIPRDYVLSDEDEVELAQ